MLQIGPAVKLALCNKAQRQKHEDSSVSYSSPFPDFFLLPNLKAYKQNKDKILRRSATRSAQTGNIATRKCIIIRNEIHTMYWY